MALVMMLVNDSIVDVVLLVHVVMSQSSCGGVLSIAEAAVALSCR